MARLGGRGEGRIGCILWLIVLGLGVMIAVKAVPVKLTDVEFGDFIDEQAQFAGRTSGEEITKRILRKAKELDLPLSAKNLKVEKSMNRVRIVCDYTVTVDFGFTTYDWHFEHEVDRPVFIV